MTPGGPQPGTPVGRGEVSLPIGGPPFVAAGVDPSAIHAQTAYAVGIHARRGSASLPKAELPLSPSRPPIPHLTGAPTSDGRTMADFARGERVVPGPAPRSPLGGIIQEGAPSAPPAPAARAAGLKLLPMDILPAEAKEDPAYVQGQGSEFAAHQPSLAAKYGVYRNGQFVPPQKLVRDSGKPGLRPETVRDLEELRKLSEGQSAPGLDQGEAEAKKAVEDGLGGAAGRVGNEPGDNSTKPEDREAAVRKAIDQMDSFELSQWRQLMMKQILHGEPERKLIESRLKPLDIGELITKGVIRQRIPIIPGKYEITLQSYDGQVDLALKRLVMMESKSVDVGEQYHLDKYSFMVLAVGLHKINDRPYADVVDPNGLFNDDLFLAKFNQIMRLPMHMLASIGVNQMWFEMRVRKLYSASAVGNG